MNITAIDTILSLKVKNTLSVPKRIYRNNNNNFIQFLGSVFDRQCFKVGSGENGAAAMLQARPNVYATSANLCSLEAPLTSGGKT